MNCPYEPTIADPGQHHQFGPGQVQGLSLVIACGDTGRCDPGHLAEMCDLEVAACRPSTLSELDVCGQVVVQVLPTRLEFTALKNYCVQSQQICCGLCVARSKRSMKSINDRPYLLRHWRCRLRMHWTLKREAESTRQSDENEAHIFEVK